MTDRNQKRNENPLRASAAECSETERSDGERNEAADARAKKINAPTAAARDDDDATAIPFRDLADKAIRAAQSDAGALAKGRRDIDEPATDSRQPDIEVRPRSARRRFSPQYKADIVEQANACRDQRQIGELLRREGLYSSYLSKWRIQYKRGALDALKDDNRGRKKIRDPKDDEIRRLQVQNRKLDKELKQAKAIIDIQKKIAALLGNPIDESTLPTFDDDETI